MAKLTAAQVTEKWARNTQGNIQSFKDGVMAVTESPGQKAAAQVERYKEGVRRAADDGVWGEAVASVPLAEWKQLTAEKGASRITEGVSKAKPKAQRFFEQLLPHAEGVKQAIAQMPKGTDADGDARMLAAVRMMRQFKFRRR